MDWTFLRDGTANYRGITRLPGLPTTEVGQWTGCDAEAESVQRGIEMCGNRHFYIEITMILNSSQMKIILSL
jgi:hypothetical protein